MMEVNESIRKWFNWWKCRPEDVMEIRFLSSPNCLDENEIYTKVREVGLQQHIPSFGNSFFIETAEQLITILTINNNWFRKLNVYYGINPRRMIWRYSKTWKNKYQSYGKGYASISSINFLAFDMEAVGRKGAATPEQLKASLITANDLKNYLLDKHQWNNFYKACSGGGHHLVLKLDEPIIVPEFPYAFVEGMQDIVYDINSSEEFNEVKTCMNNFLEKVSQKTEEHYKCKVDKVGDAPRVLRVPFTVNWKGAPAKAEILEANYEGDNIGLFEKIYEFRTKRKTWNAPPKEPFRRIKSIEELRLEPLTKLLLTPNLPQGDRNHYLEFQYSLLLRENGFNLNDVEVNKITGEIEKAQGQRPQLDFRYLPAGEVFSSTVVNKWCENNLLSPVYELLPNKVERRNIILPRFVKKSIVKDEWNGVGFPLIINSYANQVSKHPYNSFGASDVMRELNGVLVWRFGENKAEYYWNNYVKEYIDKWVEGEVSG